jgi:DNA-binding beta-propeller fold protein YncE
VDIGFDPDMSYALGYIPSDPVLDKYLYVYPDDETRRIVRKIGNGLGLTWSVTWDGSSIWTATLNGKIYRLDPVSGAVLQQFTAPGSQPWGMTWDGQHLWVVDFAEKRISKIDPTSGLELATYPTPDPVGGCKGVAWDGTYLNVMGWTSPKIYRMTTGGTLVTTIDVPMLGNAGGIAWDGTHFWIPGGKIMRVDTQGQVVGWIYPASEGTWDMTWDGQYLWASQRTNENWDDAKLFALELLEVQTTTAVLNEE